MKNGSEFLRRFPAERQTNRLSNPATVGHRMDNQGPTPANRQIARRAVIGRGSAGYWRRQNPTVVTSTFQDPAIRTNPVIVVVVVVRRARNTPGNSGTVHPSTKTVPAYSRPVLEEVLDATANAFSPWSATAVLWVQLNARLTLPMNVYTLISSFARRQRLRRPNLPR